MGFFMFVPWVWEILGLLDLVLYYGLLGELVLWAFRRWAILEVLFRFEKYVPKALRSACVVQRFPGVP